jgi:hypothetical protein
MQPDSPVSVLAHTIQLAVAPVFLLSGVGAFLGVLTNRLARIIDRTRALEEPRTRVSESNEAVRGELRVLRARGHLINRAIGMCTYCALLVAGVIVVLFVGAVARVDLAWVVAAAFVAAMLALIAGLLSFLREVHLATRHMRDTHPPD